MITTVELTNAIENNLYSHYVEITKCNNRKMSVSDDFSWVANHPAIWPSYIFRANFEPESMEREIKSIARLIEAGQLPNAWLIGPSSRPAGLENALCDNGFRKRWHSLGMALVMDEMNDDFVIPEGLDIRTVTNTDDLSVWASVFTRVMMGGSSGDADEFTALFAGLVKNERFRFFTAFYEGKAVGTSAVFLSDGAAGIYHITTTEEMRNKGIGRNITLAPLKHARKLGYQTAILQGSSLGEVIYKKIGFKEYCKISEYNLAMNG